MSEVTRLMTRFRLLRRRRRTVVRLARALALSLDGR
jgi:hypothetical protein